MIRQTESGGRQPGVIASGARTGNGISGAPTQGAPAVIRVQNLCKEYFIGEDPLRGQNFREMISTILSRPFHRLRGLQGQAADRRRIWALKDISFDISRGQVTGIIGRNGAGKSTLLKTISRITAPTSGRIEIYGRVSSLLEVGTGFHPELTGRENIYLNGAVLGMTRKEVKERFSQIVDFAEITKFLDTPVKRYSSGMYMRLAFSVAAHLDSEILLVDEVLAVGDISFQKKCLGKMNEVASGGRTVLFVSHNLDAIGRLCDRALLLENGELVLSGEPGEIISRYLQDGKISPDNQSTIFHDEENTTPARFRSVSLKRVPRKDESLESGLVCRIEYEISRPNLDCVVAIRVDAANGAPVMTVTDIDLDTSYFSKVSGSYAAECDLPIGILAPGTYRITLSLADMKTTRYDFREHALLFHVTQSPRIKTTFSREGPILPATKWSITRLSGQ